MKILHYIDNFLPVIGGGELYIDNIIKNLPGFEFDVLTSDICSGLKKEKYYKRSTIYRIPPSNSSEKSSSLVKRSSVFFFNTLKSYLRLKKKKIFLKNNKYDLIHFHGEGINIEFITFDKIIKTPFLSFLPDFNFLPAKKILTLHSFISYFTNHPVDLWWEKRLIDMFDNIICVDLFIYNEVKNIVEKIGASKNVWFIPNSVNINKFKFLPLKKSSKLKVLFVGRLSEERGLNLILDFIKNLPDFIDFTFVGASSIHLPEDIKEHHDLSNIVFLGNISNDRLPEFYQNADVVLNFVKVPGISRITLEAMASGRPVVMLDIGDRTPIINKKTGFLIKEDMEELIALLHHISENRISLADMSYQARKVIESEYSNYIILKKIEAIYKSAVL